MTGVNALQQWNRCPECIEIGETSHPVRLLKRDNLYGIRSADAGRIPGDVEIEPIGEDVAIAHAAPSPALEGDFELLPVYAASEVSTPAVATERVFLRLDEQSSPRNLKTRLEKLGFVLAEIPSYAPHCAWLEPASGRVDEALSKLGELRALPHVAHVDPQLLRPRRARPANPGAPPAAPDGAN